MNTRPLSARFLLALPLCFAAACLGLAPGAARAQGENPTPASPGAETQENLVHVRMNTSMGEIVLELDADKAPISVENFVTYVKDGHYDGTIFHRVIPGFMIQGGGFTPDMKQKSTRDPIKNEWKNGLKNARGTIAMARTQVADSATSQFFINVVDNPSLDQPSGGGAAYAVFGRVIEGMDVVDKIRAVPTTRKGMHDDVPVTPVVIKEAEVVEDYSAE